MDVEVIGKERIGTQQFSLFRTKLPNGRHHFVAKTSFGKGEVVYLDHWNLAALQREIREILPVMTLARASNQIS